MSCKFFAPNGNPSILYEDLKEKYNIPTAESTWLKTKSVEFTEQFGNLITIDKNGEPVLKSLEELNQVLVSTETGILDLFVADIVQNRKRQLVTKALVNAGIEIDIDVDEDLETSGKIITKNNRLTIKVSPSKIKLDTYFHETGHILVDLIENRDFINKGIEQLRNTELWNKVKKAYPELSDERLGKEVLTTAIGIEANEIFEAKDRNKWLFWFNQLLRKIGEIFGVDINVAKKLASQLVNGKVTETLNNKLRVEEQYQRDLELVNTVFTRKEDFLRKAGDVIRKKIAIYYTNLSDAEKAANPTFQKFNELLKLFDELNPAETNADIIKFIKLMYEQTGLLQMRINQVINPTAKDIDNGKDKVDFKFLKSIIQYNETFSLINDLVDIIEEDKGLGGELDAEEKNRGIINSDVRSYIDNIYSRFANVKRAAKRLTIKMLAGYYSSLPGKSKLILAKREELEREFNKTNAVERKEANSKGGKILDNFRRKRTDWIDAQIEEIKPEMAREELRRFEILLEQSDHDITWMERMFLDGDTVSDEVINIVSQVLDKAEYNTMTTVNNEYRVLVKLIQNFEKVKNSGNQQKKYDDMIEDEVVVDETGNIVKTNKKTNKLVSKYYSSFFTEQKKAWKIYNDLIAKKEAGQNVEEDEITGALLSAKKWGKENTINIGTKLEPKYIPIDRWLNPQYEAMQRFRESDSPIAKLFDYFLDRLEQDDKNLPEWAKLGSEVFDTEIQYKLPSIIKSKLESIYDGSLIENVKNRTKNIFKKEDDTEFGTNIPDTSIEDLKAITGEPVGASALRETIDRYMNVLVNETGQEKNQVPIYFRYRLDNKDQSYDLASLMLLNQYMAENYKNKLEIQPQVELTLDMVKEREVPLSGQTGFSGIKYKIDRLLSSEVDRIPVIMSGESSNAHRALKSMTEDRLYGIASASGVATTKIARVIAAYTGNVTLIGNYLSAGANLAFGITSEWIESIGGVYFDKKNLANATGKYSLELANGQLISDLGVREIKSKTSLLIEKFNALADWRAVTRRFLADNRLKMLGDTHMLHFLNGGAEHMMQSVLMYAVLDNSKVLGADGLYLTKEGTTEDASKAMSLDEAYTVTSDGLKIDERVTHISLPSGNLEFNDDSEFLVSRLIKDLNAELHGQYSSDKRAEIQRYWYGTLLMLLRKWMPRGIIRRWRGISSSLIPTEQLMLSDKYYSRAGMNRREGYYTTSTRFVWNMIKQGKQLKWEMVTTDWSKLIDYERSNIKKTVADFALMVSMYGIAVALKGLGDDENDEKTKNFYYLMAFYSYRLHSELNTYINPAEAARTLKNPSAALTMVSRGLSLLHQLVTNPFEEYERGDRKGQLKLRKKLEDVVPIIKQLDRNVEDALTWLFSPRAI